MNARRTLCIALIFNAVAALSQKVSQAAASDVTVRLFYSQNVDALTITPASQSGTVRRCQSCPDLPLRSPLSVKLQAPGMLVNGSSAKELEITGAVRVETGSGRTATAAGKWQLHPAHDGLHLTVTLPSERYVMAVLVSEASPQEPSASLQALAIAARSFALTHLRRHNVDGFDFCDSTHCQALRLAPVNDAIRNAVDATAGETIWFQGRPAAAYFTQNCGGVTEDAALLWGGSPRPWLTSHPDPWCQRFPSAWHASLNQDELRQALAFSGLPVRGAISNVLVTKHDPSGRAATIAFVTDKRQIHLPAATFRFAVGRTLGWNRLRSDWYATNFSAGIAQFDGKGFGHGVGLCQAGAAAMATEGHADMRSILRFYFPGTETRIAASDDGWREVAANGWTLVDTSPTDDAMLLREGNLAWSRANSLLHQPLSSRNAKVSVRVFPSTELFRSSTGEPGWVIGATRGNAISLQPVRIIKANESLQSALLHEMLHVLVERQSNASTPLWLREGIVEVLASRNLSAAPAIEPAMSLGDIDAALMNATSVQQAHRAHLAAADTVRRLIGDFGLATVRGWLSSGVPPGALAKAGVR